MRDDPFHPAEFMRESAPLFDWEEDLLPKAVPETPRDEVKAASDELEPQPASLWERLRRR